jgi:peptide/nickel transport system substrate-binding protein
MNTTKKTSLSRRAFVQGSTALTVAAAAGPRLGWGAQHKVLRIRSYADLQRLDPAFTLSAPEDDIQSCIFNRLISYKAGDAWEWELDAASAIEQQGKNISFTLRPGIQWTNGFGELTAEDVKYSFERVADPELDSPYKEDWVHLDRVDVKDKYTGVIVLKEASPMVWTTTLVGVGGKIVCKEAVEALPEKKFSTVVPASSGPYYVKEWIPKQKTTLARNPDWNGPKPDFDVIEIYPIEDEKAAEIGFEAGDLDYTVISLSSLPSYRESLPAGAKLLEKPSLKYVWLGINIEHPQFSDIRVRKAIQKAVDIDAILQSAYFGVADAATGIVAPGLVGNRGYNLTERDPDAARSLLEEAGYGGGFKTTLNVLNKADFVTMAQVVQANLAEIGIEVEINQMDSGVWWTMGMESEGEAWKDVQLFLQRFSTLPDPGWTTMWFTCDQVGVWNWERWCNEEFTELHRKAMVELDPAKRDVMYKRMQDLMEESGAYRFITHEATPALYRDTIIPATTPDGGVVLRDFKQA